METHFLKPFPYHEVLPDWSQFPIYRSTLFLLIYPEQRDTTNLLSRNPVNIYDISKSYFNSLTNNHTF